MILSSFIAFSPEIFIDGISAFPPITTFGSSPRSVKKVNISDLIGLQFRSDWYSKILDLIYNRFPWQ